MRVTIENLLAYSLLDLTVEEGVTVVAGKNATGKSSLAMILGALVANMANPGGLDAAKRKAYIRDGQHEGEASIETPEGQVITWRPGSGSIVRPEPDIPVWSIPEAVGLVDFMEKRTTKEARQKMWKGLFESEEDPEVLLKESWGEGSAGDLPAILKIIKEKGWDAAYSIMEDKRRESKALWCAVTSSRAYGDRLAAKWTPDHWDATLATASEAELQAELTNARDDLTSIAACAAVSASDIAKAKDAKVRADALRDAIREKRERQGQLRDLDEIRHDLNETNTKLSEVKSRRSVSEIQVDEAKKAKSEIPEVEKRVNTLAGEIKEATAKVQATNVALKEIDRLGVKLDEEHRGALALMKSHAPYKCPGCGHGLEIYSEDSPPLTDIVKWVAPTGEDQAEAQDIIDSYGKDMELLNTQRQDTFDEGRNEQTKGREKAQEQEQLKGRLTLLREQAKLAAATPIPHEDIAKERQELEGQVESLMKQISTFQLRASEIAEMAGEAKSLEEQAHLADAEPTEIDADARAAAENGVQSADQRLAAFMAWRKANAAFKNVVEFDHLCKLLAADGVRAGSRAKINETMEKINGLLTKITGITGWPTVKLSPSYEILINGRPLGVPMAESEKLRAQWAIQLVFAVRANCKWIILDKCDTIKDEAWEGLLKIAEYWQGKNPSTYLVLCATSPPSTPGSAKIVSTDM